MRTTLALDDDVLEEVKRFAEDRKVSLGRAASELIRRGISRPLQTHLVNGLHVVSLPGDSPTVTAERVHDLINEQYDDELRKAMEFNHEPKRKR